MYCKNKKLNKEIGKTKIRLVTSRSMKYEVENNLKEAEKSDIEKKKERKKGRKKEINKKEIRKKVRKKVSKKERKKETPAHDDG
jgi:hypothetical protein